MIVLGIDPGSRNTGIGIIQTNGNHARHIHSLVINCEKLPDLSSKLEKISQQLMLLIEEFKPDLVALESAFVGMNARSSLILGHVRGAIMLSLKMKQRPLYEYSPKQIKLALTGNGLADKHQVRNMVRVLLNLSQKKLALDESDALAIAICGSVEQNINDKLPILPIQK